MLEYPDINNYQTFTSQTIVVGVSGHRDLIKEDYSILRQKLTDIWREISENFPEARLTILSSLAAGADCLMAEVALSLGAELVVPLPMEVEEYQKDFLSPSVRDKFTTLLSQAQTSFVVPLPAHDQEVDINRSERYAIAGSYIAENSQILIALWDGVFNEKTAGTAQVVKLVLSMLPEITSCSEDKLPKYKMMYYVPTPRIQCPKPMHPAYSVYKIFSRGDFTGIAENFGSSETYRSGVLEI